MNNNINLFIINNISSIQERVFFFYFIFFILNVILQLKNQFLLFKAAMHLNILLNFFELMNVTCCNRLFIFFFFFFLLLFFFLYKKSDLVIRCSKKIFFNILFWIIVVHNLFLNISFVSQSWMFVYSFNRLPFVEFATKVEEIFFFLLLYN
jgi:hypothetical protein